MAERRMFAKSVIESDIFLDLPISTRLLYYDLGMRGDDDGFVDSPRRVMRLTGASDDDLKLLIAKQFLIPFESGVVVIRHWKIHNYIRPDRYKPTQYQIEKALLIEETAGTFSTRLSLGIPADHQMSTTCLPDGYITEQNRTEQNKTEDNIGKKGASRFTPPTVEEVKVYCQERGNGVDPQVFVDFYASKGWKVGNAPMKDWQAAVRTWEKRSADNGEAGITSKPKEDRSDYRWEDGAF